MPYIDAINIGFPYNAIAMFDFWLPEVRVVAVMSCPASCASVHRNGGALLVDRKNWKDTIQSINNVHTSNTWGTTRDCYFLGLVFCLFFLQFGFCFFVVLLAFVVFVCSVPSLFFVFSWFLVLLAFVVSWKYPATMVQTTSNTSIRQNTHKL